MTTSTTTDGSHSTAHGMRYKRHVVYCKRLPGDTSNSAMQRTWFVTKNIARMPYEPLETWSKYYVNVYHKGMQYDADVHSVLDTMDHMIMTTPPVSCNRA